MKKVIQNDIYDCGICSLKAIINYYHGDVPLEVLRYDTFTDCGGTDMYHLLNAAKKYGLEGYGLNTSLDDLDNYPKPLICHVILKNHYEHFMVLERVSNNHVFIMDPAKGNVKLSKQEFNEIFTGKVLILYPHSKLTVIKESEPLSKVFLNLVFQEKGLLFRLMIVTIIITILTILYSLLFKLLLNDNYIFTSNQFIKIALFYSGILFFIILFNLLKDYYRSYLSKNLDAFIKATFIKHIFYLPSYSIKSRNAGEILTRLNELNNYKTLLTDYLVNLGLDFITISITGLILLWLNKYLFLMLIIMIILYLLFSLLVNRLIRKKIDDVLTKESDYNTNLVENINNLDSLKNLHLEKSGYQLNEKLNTEMLYANFKFELSLHNINFIKTIIHDSFLLLINLLGISFIYQSKLVLVDLITFNALIVYFKDPLKNYIDMLPQITYIQSSYQKLKEFFQVQEEKFNNQSVLMNYGDIEFKDVSITYDGVNNIISDVSFKINKYNKAFIKGKSGSGKSSLCKALYRLNDNYQGAIMIDDYNIKDLDLNAIRYNIGYLGQKEGLYSDTIYNNIVMNRPVSDVELKRVCKICEIDEILKNKPLRLNTMLYEGGKNLSGGERQRILLARILLKYPDILILDEALSELNMSLEKQILKNLETYLKSRTLIYISHRFIDNYFDQVICLNDN